MTFQRPRFGALVCALVTTLAAGAAQATTFDFSYTFGDGTLLSGSLTGDLAGSFVHNIGHVQVSLNGHAFSGSPLFAAAWNTTTHNWDNSIEARISTDATLNNFVLADADVPVDFNVSNYVYFVNDNAALFFPTGQEVFATNLNTGDIALDNPGSGQWSLVAQPVPEPATFVLTALGLGLVGAAVRRRRS